MDKLLVLHVELATEGAVWVRGDIKIDHQFLIQAKFNTIREVGAIREFCVRANVFLSHK